MVMTFNSLVQQVQDELDRYDTLFVSYIPSFIYQATDRINADLKNIGLEQYVSGVFEAGAISGGSVIPKPARWRRQITFNYGTGTGNNTYTPLQLASYEWCRNYAKDATVTAPPKYYADYGPYNLLVVPTPDQAYPFELSYLEIPATISEAQQTNWITNYAPSLYLYATLLECVIYLKLGERIPEMEAEYQKRLQPLIKQDSDRKIDRTVEVDAD